MMFSKEDRKAFEQQLADAPKNIDSDEKLAVLSEYTRYYYDDPSPESTTLWLHCAATCQDEMTEHALSLMVYFFTRVAQDAAGLLEHYRTLAQQLALVDERRFISTVVQLSEGSTDGPPPLTLDPNFPSDFNIVERQITRTRTSITSGWSSSPLVTRHPWKKFLSCSSGQIGWESVCKTGIAHTAADPTSELAYSSSASVTLWALTSRRRPGAHLKYIRYVETSISIPPFFFYLTVTGDPGRITSGGDHSCLLNWTMKSWPIWQPDQPPGGRLRRTLNTIR